MTIQWRKFVKSLLFILYKQLTKSPRLYMYIYKIFVHLAPRFFIEKIKRVIRSETLRSQSHKLIDLELGDLVEKTKITLNIIKQLKD